MSLDLSKRFLFRFSLPCRYVPELVEDGAVRLNRSYRLPTLATLEGDRTAEELLDFRIGWNEQGLAIVVEVSGRRQLPWCRPTRPENSEGLQICLDTRDVRNVHRATRYCHRLFFLPTGEGSRMDQPSALWLPIHRARAHPNPVPVQRIQLRSEVGRESYRMEIVLPGTALTGFDPEEHPNLGFHYCLVDRELGNRTLATQSPMPYDENPSLWSTLELLPQTT